MSNEIFFIHGEDMHLWGSAFSLKRARELAQEAADDQAESMAIYEKSNADPVDIILPTGEQT